MPANPRTKPNPRDHTGRQKALLAEENADKIAKRRDEIAMHQAQERANLDVPVQLDDKGREVRVVSDADEQAPVQVQKEWATIRIACDLEKVTVGQGTEYEFKEGQVYKVPMKVAVHLDRLGYVWQWL